MQTVVLHTTQGGSGKSTLARELAVAAASTLQVALADLDPQGTTSRWYQRRDAKSPVLVNLDPAKPTRHLIDAGVDLLVVDTRPGQPPYIGKLLAGADMALMPVRPTPDDLLAAAPIATSLARHPAWAFVRWTHPVGQFGGWVKLGPGCCQAGSFTTAIPLAP